MNKLQFIRFNFAHARIKHLRFALFIAAAALINGALLWQSTPTSAQPGANCSASFFVDQTLSNGARWQLCWEQRNLDGIVLRDIYYTSPTGLTQRVLSEGSISQVHVPYDDNSARFHDITDDGFGEENLNDLTPAECPNGTLLKYGTKDAICQQIQPRGYAFKGLGMQQQGELLSLFSVSISGEYNYIPVWRFLDNGTIELLMGAAGKLQRFTTDSRFGWPVRADGTRGTSHIHNYYWRLDFDLGENADNDIVEEFNYTADTNNRRTLGVSRLISETGRSLNPTALRSWRIRDGELTNANGQAISYQLEPMEVGHRDVGPSFEPWTNDQFYVTKARSCERYVSHNPQINGCANNLAGFVNGESLDAADVVLWYGATFHHIPRDEDEPLMHAHWTGFRLTPRDWMATNPSAGDIATCAVGDVTCDTKLDAADALFMLQYDVQLRTNSHQLPLAAGTLYGYSCDISGEGDCNAVDSMLSLQCSVGLQNQVCPGVAGIQSAQTSSAEIAPLVITVEKGSIDSNGAIHKLLHVDSAAKLGALSLTLAYDPTWQGVVTCLPDPNSGFDLNACRVDPTAGTVQLSVIATAGASGKMTAGELIFTPAQSNSLTFPLLIVQNLLAASAAGNPLPVQTKHADLAEKLYLPLVIR